MYTISKEFHFSASHILHGLADGHPCGRLHGHNYVIIVTLTSPELNEHGFVQDYGELKDIGRFIDNVFDHRHLNDQMEAQPSAENIAKYLYDIFRASYPLISSISVKETPKTIATFLP